MNKQLTRNVVPYQNFSPTTAELVAALGGWLMVPIVGIFGEETAGRELTDIVK